MAHRVFILFYLVIGKKDNALNNYCSAGKTQLEDVS